MNRSSDPPIDYALERRIAVQAVARAASLCIAVRAEKVVCDALTKGDMSPVTIADWGAQALVCQHLRNTFPDDPIVGEENAAALKEPENAPYLDQVSSFVGRWIPGAGPREICRWIDAGGGAVANRFWTLDPVDGTKGFLRNDQYAIALALIDRGRVQVAALACPALPLQMNRPDGPAGALFVAVRGCGASLMPLEGGTSEPTHVAIETDQAALRFVESVEAAHGDQDLQQTLARATGISRPPLRMDSQAKYGAVARGDAVLYLRLPSPKSPDYRENIWDHAAGALIVEESGGRVTDLAGRPLDFAHDRKLHRNRGVVASNRVLHDRVIEAWARLGGAS